AGRPGCRSARRPERALRRTAPPRPPLAARGARGAGPPGGDRRRAGRRRRAGFVTGLGAGVCRPGEPPCGPGPRPGACRRGEDRRRLRPRGLGGRQERADPDVLIGAGSAGRGRRAGGAMLRTRVGAVQGAGRRNRRLEPTPPAPAGARRRATEAPDPQELRRRAYAALRELLARLGDRRPLVVAIDDLQWGDGDSLAVLSAILRPPDTPAMLLLACYRSEDSANPVLRAALTPPGAQGLDCRELSVGTLSPDDAHALARHMLGVVGGDAEGRARWIASES